MDIRYRIPGVVVALADSSVLARAGSAALVQAGNAGSVVASGSGASDSTAFKLSQ